MWMQIPDHVHDVIDKGHLGMMGFQCKRDRLAMIAIAWVAKESNACVGTVALLLA